MENVNTVEETIENDEFESAEKLDKWTGIFSFLGWSLIVVASINLIMAFDTGFIWECIITTVAPMIGSAIGLFFTKDLIAFLIDFYANINEIKINTRK